MGGIQNTKGLIPIVVILMLVSLGVASFTTFDCIKLTSTIDFNSKDITTNFGNLSDPTVTSISTELNNVLTGINTFFGPFWLLS